MISVNTAPAGLTRREHGRQAARSERDRPGTAAGGLTGERKLLTTPTLLLCAIVDRLYEARCAEAGVRQMIDSKGSSHPRGQVNGRGRAPFESSSRTPRAGWVQLPNRRVQVTFHPP